MSRRPEYKPRTGGAGSGRVARGPVHRVARRETHYATSPVDFVAIEWCRCGAWRAHVGLDSTAVRGGMRGMSSQFTVWNMPCTGGR